MNIPAAHDGERLDVALTILLDLSRSQVKKMITKDQILVNGSLPKKSGDIIHTDDVIEVQAAKEEHGFEVAVEQVDATLEPTIIKETDDYLVIDKPSGLLTHPTQAGEPWSLSHWVWREFPKLKRIGEYDDRPGIVHRLDKETSGLMVIAKTQTMFDHLKEQFKDRSVDKRYTTLVHGIVERDIDIIDFDIDRGTDGRMVARPKTDTLKLKNVGKHQPGKYAKTEFLVLERFSRYTLLDVKIYTGRTHQIRVHLYAYNNPVVGDPLYTNNKLKRNLDESIGRLFLHSHLLSFSDLSGKRIETIISLPDDLQTIIDTLT